MNHKMISYEDFKKTDTYSKFIKENPSMGSLKVQVFTAYSAIPIANAEILIFKDIDSYRVIFFKGITNSSGIIDSILLPAPIRMMDTSIAPKYTTYSLSASHTDYEAIKQYFIAMLGDTKVIQYVRMTPLVKLKGVVQNGN